MSYLGRICVLLVGLVALTLPPAVAIAAKWTAEPGSTVRNAFGPQSGAGANICRGACGGGCPASCERSVFFECAGSEKFLRVVRSDCGTHSACREHDDCLDACVENRGAGSSGECELSCDAAVIEDRDAVSAVSWLSGGGPYDGRIVFEYTQAAPDAAAAMYQCPPGTQRQCAPEGGCIADNGDRYEPAFAGYAGTSAGAMQVSAFRPGQVCGDQVCTYATDIVVTGADSCAGERCTTFGVEFDYRNADPTAPLECSTSTRGEEGDFINTLLKQGADTMTRRSEQAESTSEAQNEMEDGIRGLVGLFGKMMASADSPEDIQITMTPLDKDGNPIESERVGSNTGDAPLPVPRRVQVPASSGHLVIPMYQTVSGMKPGVEKEKLVQCSHKGEPVFETTFRLRAG